MKNKIIHITEIRRIKNNKIVKKIEVDIYVTEDKLIRVINNYDNLDFSYKIINFLKI